MTVEVRPLGDKCNIKCRYCYQDPVRAAGNLPSRYDVGAILTRLEQIDEPFTLFGGEIMMTPRADLETLLAFGRDRHGGAGLQTNGTLIEEEDLARFASHAVRVGISIDGPGPLNDARWAGSLAATRRATARTEAVIETLCREGRPPSVIVTLHRLNAGGANLEVLSGWLRFLDRLGVRRVRLHTLESDSEAVSADLALAHDASLVVMRRLAALEAELTSVRFDVFAEMEAMLCGQDRDVSCEFHACDSYATRAVTGVEGDGSLSNCGRTNKDGVVYQKTPREAYERQLGLYRTSQDHGGCAGCRFFLMCKGNCPGTAIGGDWRLRSVDCAVWFGLFEDLEGRLLAGGRTPLSLSPRRGEIEQSMVAAWEQGDNPLLAELCADSVGP